MAGVTDNYGLAVGLVTDDFVEPDHHNRVAATLDRVLGGFLKQMMADGAQQGWNLTLDGTVTAGEGLVGGCWCRTEDEQAISGLMAGATNYVFGRADLEAPTTGAIAFFAQASATKPAGAVLLGATEVDAGGVLTSVDEEGDGVDRNCLRLEIGTTRGSGLVTEIGAGEAFTVGVEHGQGFLIPGAIEFSGSEGFAWELKETHRGDGFAVVGRNDTELTADFSYSWTRKGLLG